MYHNNIYSNMTSQNKNEINLVVDNQPSGCEIAKKLWSVALECNIERPGINGTAGRINSFVKCSNILEFYTIAIQKCWEERTRTEHTITYPPHEHTITYPPQIRINKTYTSSSNSTSTKSNNKQ